MKTAQASRSQISALHSVYQVFAESASCVVLPGNVTMTGDRERRLPVHQLLLPCLNDERAQRLAWASGIIGRAINSFSELRSDEATRLIELMKKALGQSTAPRSRKRPDRDQARAYGSAGRRSNSSNEIRLVDDTTLGFVESLIAQLGWSQERFDRFLSSSARPVKSGAIRTLA